MSRLTRCVGFQNGKPVYATNIDMRCRGAVEKLKAALGAYEDKQEQGLLIEPKCSVGGKVWAITTPANYTLGRYAEVPLKHPQEKKIQSITISKNGILYHVKDRTYSEYDFGKTVFFTEAEAEEAMAKMGGSHDRA